MVLKDNGVSVTCSSAATTRASTVTGSIPTATAKGASPVKIGTVAALRLKNCTGPRGGGQGQQASVPGQSRLDDQQRGQTDAMITGVNASVAMKGCSFTVTGRAPGFYANSTHKLKMTPKLPITPLTKAQLTISNVAGCAGLIMNGDHPTFTATYTVSRAIKITSK